MTAYNRFINEVCDLCGQLMGDCECEEDLCDDRSDDQLYPSED